jgi:ribosomal-protein-alanine N-acetyltransferase
MDLAQLDLPLKTKRLILEPIVIDHASPMLEILKDAALYDFIPHDPPTLESLTERYAKWEKRISPDGNEIWLNWAARLKDTNQFVGHFQSGIQKNKESKVAYTIGVSYQRKGLAFEGLNRVCEFLIQQLDVVKIRAWIDTRNEASLALVTKLGMKNIRHIKNADFFKNSSSDEFIFEYDPKARKRI